MYDNPLKVYRNKDFESHDTFWIFVFMQWKSSCFAPGNKKLRSLTCIYVLCCSITFSMTNTIEHELVLVAKSRTTRNM